jgi:hypothetical protein
LFQMLRPIITASARPATIASRADSEPDVPSPTRIRSAASPMMTPIKNTTRPAVSDGMNVRRGVHTRESAISTRPANIVMPHNSGMPPIFSASSDGAR